MTPVSLFYLSETETIEQILCSGFPEDCFVHLSNATQYASGFWFLPPPQRQLTGVVLLEVKLDIDAQTLCREYEVDPCVGKTVRRFFIPGEYINRHAELKRWPAHFGPVVLWNEYPSREFNTNAVSQIESRYPIAFVGDPVSDVGSLPQSMRAAGFNVRCEDTVHDGDAVLFCISCPNGALAGTRESLGNCSHMRIRPLGIVTTDYDLVDDESLHGLVKAEQQELLSRILPPDLVAELPVLISGDPYFLDKVCDILSTQPAEVVCGEFKLD